MFDKSERTAVFIDGANLYTAARNLNVEIDYRLLREYLASKTRLLRITYYSAMLEQEDYTPLKPLTDWLAYNGYSLVSKPAKEFTDSAGRRRVKGNMDVEITTDLIQAAPRIDHAILFSGDSDFRYVVEQVQRLGVKVSVVSSLRATPPTIADELRRQCDQFIELQEIAQFFTRTRNP
jgi:uncharacterized LabA/DUF88 family protein